jgi:hypothetical protein
MSTIKNAYNTLEHLLVILQPFSTSVLEKSVAEILSLGYNKSRRKLTV